MIGIVMVELFETPTGASSRWSLREVVINPEFVVAMRPDDRARQLLQEGTLPNDLDARQGFTKLQMSRGNNGIDITVVGDLTTVRSKLVSLSKGSDKTLING